MFLLTLQSLHFSDMIATAFLHILQCVFALSALGINNGHDSKTSLPKRLMMSDLILDGMLLQFPYLLLVDYQYYTLQTVEKWLYGFCLDTKK